MRWQPLQLSTCFAVLLISSIAFHGAGRHQCHAMSTARRNELRQLTKDTWYHAFDSYMKFAYPADELKPLSCAGLSRDNTGNENEINDVMGGFALTLVDSLDSFVMLGDKEGFENAVRLVIRDVTFDLDSKVQVFEVTIRVLGGLLSAHIYASTPKHGFAISWYSDELLYLAHDLGRRLLPAFQHSLTGLPWARVNLRHGLSRAENMETNSAAAGSLLLEFATLSRLTGDPVFEQVARKALFSLWNRRSPLSLLGNTLNVQTGAWISSMSSIGAGVDSFFEYIAKAYILLGDDEYFRIWSEAYGAVMKWLRSNDGFWYRPVNMNTGILASVNVDSLAAFFPGLQAMMGDVESAIKSHAVFAMAWERYSGSPEIFNTQARRAEVLPWPLRPELIESTLFLYRATKDASYLDFGERVIEDITNRTRVDCGLAALENVADGRQQDRMHSFAVAETLPYLYLLFDEDNAINLDESNAVFTTEGHYLALDKRFLRPPPKSRRGEAQTCARYDPVTSTQMSSNSSKSMHEMQPGIPFRRDMEYARALVGHVLNDTEALRRGLWSESGFCESPSVEDYVVSLLFATNNEAEDVSPSIIKVEPNITSNSFRVRSIQGLRIQITRRMDNRGGYDITRIGPYRISSSSTVFLSDPAVILSLKPEVLVPEPMIPGQHVQLRFTSQAGHDFGVMAAKSAFGPDPEQVLGHQRTYRLHSLLGEDEYGCGLADLPEGQDSTLFVARRGVCTFVHKMKQAAQAGAAGIIVLSDEEELLVPSADEKELADASKIVPTILLPKSGSDALNAAFASGNVQVSLIPPPTSKPALKNSLTREQLKEELEKTPVIVNGHWLQNCKLVYP